jgi:predicted phosphodiesterase
MNITHKKTRVLAVGCSHAVYADPLAIAATLRFKEAFKPHLTIHLGDAIDCTAFMGSHIASGDGGPIEPDANAGLDYLKQLRPNVFLWGNHEHRLVRLKAHRNEFVRFAAADLCDKIDTRMALLKCQSIPYIGNRQQFNCGRVRFTHGTIYSESATRDYATSYAPHNGAIVHAHTHRPGEATGLRVDEPLGYCVGTLTTQDALEYANTRKATLGWGQAFVWGEICERTGNFQLWLHRHKYGQEWRLPV